MHRTFVRQVMFVASFVFSAAVAQADDWPQWLGPQRDSVWRESGILEVFPADGPPVRWRTAIGAGYSGPVVAQQRVYLTDRQLGAGITNSSDPFQRGSVT